MRQGVLFLAASTVVGYASLLTAYCYASESFGFRDFLFLNFDAPGKAFLSRGYRFLEAYALVISILAFCLSLAVRRRHPIFTVAGLLVTSALFTWSVLLPRY